MDVLGQPGCPACRLADAAARDWLAALFHEHVNDPEIRARLRRSRGFCREHAEAAMKLGDALGCSIIYADLLTEAAGSLAGGGPEHCPACAVGRAAAQRALGTLLGHLAEDDVLAAYRAADGLCLRHLGQAIALSRGPTAERLADMERERLARLAAECEAFVTKSDYRGIGEPKGPEGDAWQRAARKLAGGFPPHGPQ